MAAFIPPADANQQQLAMLASLLKQQPANVTNQADGYNQELLQKQQQLMQSLAFAPIERTHSRGQGALQILGKVLAAYGAKKAQDQMTQGLQEEKEAARAAKSQDVTDLLTLLQGEQAPAMGPPTAEQQMQGGGPMRANEAFLPAAARLLAGDQIGMDELQGLMAPEEPEEPELQKVTYVNDQGQTVTEFVPVEPGVQYPQPEKKGIGAEIAEGLVAGEEANLQKETHRKIEQNVVKIDEQVDRLNGILDTWDPAPYSLIGRLKQKKLAWEDYLKTASEEDAALIQRWNDQNQQISGLFQALRQEKTGAQASDKELERLGKAFFNTDMPSLELEARLRSYRKAQIRSRNILMRYRRDGIPVHMSEDEVYREALNPYLETADQILADEEKEEPGSKARVYDPEKGWQ